MHALVFAQSINKIGRHDASGAFIPGATAFRKLYGTAAPVWLNDVNDRRKVLRAIMGATGLRAIAYFGHGTHNGLPSADIRNRHIAELASAISNAVIPGGVVILYACTAGQVGGFAQKLSDAMGGRVTVFGHSCAGHSFTNPYVTRYPYTPDTQPFLIDPSGPLFAPWRRHIKAAGSNVWARFPFLTKGAVELEVANSTGHPVPAAVPRHTP